MSTEPQFTGAPEANPTVTTPAVETQVTTPCTEETCPNGVCPEGAEPEVIPADGVSPDEELAPAAE